MISPRFARGLEPRSGDSATADRADEQVLHVLLISCYELGHQPFATASAAAHLRSRGHAVECVDLAVEPLDPDAVRRADVVGISIPMHTATRLGVRAGDRVRDINPDCHIVYFGLYASLNADYLLARTADSVIGGEFETPLAEHLDRLAAGERNGVAGVIQADRPATPFLGRQRFLPPARDLLPPLNRYARLQTATGELKLVGYVEASRGCAHRCRHCPIPAVYEGRLRVLQRDVVLEDIANLLDLGAQHINFGDPDFLNGVKHSLAIVRAMHQRYPDLTFDFTAKIEHLIEHRDAVRELGALGCVFILTAVESIDDETLRHLDKGHVKTDVVRALRIAAEAGIALRPSLLPFTPWTTLEGYSELLDFVERHGLVYHIDPVQYSIRLLLPAGSLLLRIPEIQPFVGEFVPEDFLHPWKHPDPRVDALQRQVARIAEEGARRQDDPALTFYRIRDETSRTALGRPSVSRTLTIARPVQKPPKLTEDWFC